MKITISDLEAEKLLEAMEAVNRFDRQLKTARGIQGVILQMIFDRYDQDIKHLDNSTIELEGNELTIKGVLKMGKGVKSG